MSVDTPGWVKDAIFYQIFPDRFARSGRVLAPGAFEPWDVPPTRTGFKGGDLYGVTERLPELADLGVTALYLNPVFASAANHRYHAYDYMTVDPLLGGDAALRELLDTAHALGIRIILDGVFNHCGRGFWPFNHVAENGAASPYADWFMLDPAVTAGHERLDPYPRIEPGPDPLSRNYQGGYRAWWGLSALPKLNVANPMVREYLMQVGEHWLRFGIDGWRLDVPDEIEDTTFWMEFRARCRAVDPDAYLVGEIWEIAPGWVGDPFDALMNYPLGALILGFAGAASLDQEVVDAHHVYRAMIHPLDGAAFSSQLEMLTGIYEPEIVAAQLNLIGSHDAPRALTVLGSDVAALRAAFTLLLTLPGAPCIYYGDEIGMRGHDDPDCRGAYPIEADAGDRALRAFVASLAAARHAHAALRRGEVRRVGATKDAVVLGREADGERALVAVNAGREAVSVALDAIEGSWLPLPALVSPGVELQGGSAAGSTTTVWLPAQSVAIYVEST